MFKAKKTATKTESKASAAGRLLALTQLARPRWTQRRYDSAVDEAFRKNVIVWRCVTMVAEAAASIPLVLYDSRDKIITRHKLLTLLQRPNPLGSMVDFMASLCITYQLAGNVFIEAVRPDAESPPAELYNLRPDRMKVLPGHAGLPMGYEYTVGNHTQRWGADALTGASDILHWRNFNPLDDWYGIAPLEAALMSIDQHNAAANWNQSLLQHGARPSGALVYNPKEGPATLTQEQISKLRDEFDSGFTGARNAGRPLILEGGLEWKNLSLSPQEMEWLRGRDIAARDIALAFGVPAQLVGIADKQTYNNMLEARLALYEETVLPLITRLIGALNHWLVPMFDANVRLAIDADEISALGPRREMLWGKIGSADFLTINEKRLALGYPPRADGDVLI